MKVALGMCIMVVMAAIAQGCSTVPSTQAGRDALHQDVLATIDRFKSRDPSMAERFEQAQGYAVFPSVTKGGAGIGGAHGRGELFESGEFVGYCDVTQATIGPQLGAQEYSEVIFFQDSLALESFKDGKLAFAAQASAVAAKAGASADADYEGGVLVFTMTRGGLMYEASIGGQKFDFVPK